MMPYVLKYTVNTNTQEPKYKPHQILLHRGRSIDSGGNPSQIIGLNRNQHFIHSNPLN